MKKIIFSISLFCLLCSCAQTRSGVSSSVIFTSWSDTVSGSVNNSVPVEKRGEACAFTVLGVVSLGDSSIETAKKSVAIKDVAFVDTTYVSVFGFAFQKGCTIVKGK